MTAVLVGVLELESHHPSLFSSFIEETTMLAY